MSESKVRELRATAAAALKRGDLRGAIDAYQAAIKLESPPDPTELDRLGMLLHASGARAAAVACFRQSAEIEGKQRAPVRAVLGRDPSVLVVAFTGFHGMVGVSRLNFLEAAGLQDYSLLALWDSTYRLFLGGVPGVAGSYQQLVDLILARMPKFAPKKVIAVGCSGSALSALLYGNAIKADVVHAFGPPVSLDLDIVRARQPAVAEHYREFMQELADAGIEKRVMHLPGMLDQNNGKTQYFVHYGRLNREDNERAHFLAGKPGVELIEHETASHQTAELLARANLLKDVFAAKSSAGIPRLR